MGDLARDPTTLEILRVQRGRLADRLRPRWWYLAGIAFLWALVFAAPFGSRYLPRGISPFPLILIVAAPVTCLLYWGQTRATGIAAGGSETTLLRHGLLAVALIIAALAVAAEVAVQQALLRAIRQDLRRGGGAA